MALLIPPDATGRHAEAGPILRASAQTYLEAVGEIRSQVLDGHRLTWIRSTTADLGARFNRPANAQRRAQQNRWSTQ